MLHNFYKQQYNTKNIIEHMNKDENVNNVTTTNTTTTNTTVDPTVDPTAVTTVDQTAVTTVDQTTTTITNSPNLITKIIAAIMSLIIVLALFIPILIV